MKTFQITVSNEADMQKVTDVLREMQRQKVIEIHEQTVAPVAPSYEQIEEMIDESELGPYYSEEEAKAILHL